MHHFLQEKSKKSRLFSQKSLILLHHPAQACKKNFTPLSFLETKKN